MTFTHTRPVAKSWIVCLTLSAGCSDGGSAGYTTAAGGSTGAASSALTDLEQVSLRKDFGRLAATAPADASNAAATSAAAAKLGQALFFDPRYSANGQVACATCHIPEAGFQDNRANTSQGIEFTGRHAPSVLNAAFGPADGERPHWQYWDGRTDSLWAQALGPPESAGEMGGTRSRIALLIYDKYRIDYEAAFPADSPMPSLRDAEGAALIDEAGGPHADGDALRAWQDLARDNPELERAVTRVYVNFGKAIAAYESHLVSRNSRFDRFRDAVVEGVSDGGHLSPSELRGFKLFVGKAACSSCHRGPNLTDGKFHNIGVAQTAPHVLASDRGRADGMIQVRTDEFNCESEWSDAPDPAACAVSTLDVSEDSVREAVGAFKTPTLRSVARTGPYFHTGSAASLLDVVAHYERGGDDGNFEGSLDETLRPIELTEQDKQDLVDFMGALDGEPLPEELTRSPELPK
jgi:cytochrome c peroxidase